LQTKASEHLHFDQVKQALGSINLPDVKSELDHCGQVVFEKVKH
jgi:hypothetical protein